jgi:hypothetical protein
MANLGFPSIVFLIKNCLWNEDGKSELNPNHSLINYFKNIIQSGRCNDAEKLVVGHDLQGQLAIQDSKNSTPHSLQYSIQFSPLAIEINDYFKEAFITGKLLSHMEETLVSEVYQTFKIRFDYDADKTLFIKSFELTKTYNPSENFLTVMPAQNTVSAAA